MSIRVTLNIEKENPADPEFDFDMEQTAQAVCERVLEREKCPVDTEISITLVDDDAIRDINRESRGIDVVTDVLSFPNLDITAPEDGEESADRWADAMQSAWDCMNPETGNLFLGDIVLNLDRVRLQADEYGHSRRREFAFLIAHSMLHLCGYDHMDSGQEEVMFGRQESVLKELGITRDVSK